MVDTIAIWGFETVRAVFPPVPYYFFTELQTRIGSRVLARGAEPTPYSALRYPLTPLGVECRSTETVTELDMAILIAILAIALEYVLADVLRYGFLRLHLVRSDEAEP